MSEREPERVTEGSVLACEIADAIGFSFADATDPAESDHLNADGAWEYHFETDSAWGFVAAGPDGPVETTYPGWGDLTVKAFHWCVFHEGALAAVFSPTGGEVAGGREIGPKDVEAAMTAAFRTERDALDGQEGER